MPAATVRQPGTATEPVPTDIVNPVVGRSSIRWPGGCKSTYVRGLVSDRRLSTTRHGYLDSLAASERARESAPRRTDMLGSAGHRILYTSTLASDPVCMPGTHRTSASSSGPPQARRAEGGGLFEPLLQQESLSPSSIRWPISYGLIRRAREPVASIPVVYEEIRLRVVDQLSAQDAEMLMKMTAEESEAWIAKRAAALAEERVADAIREEAARRSSRASDRDVNAVDIVTALSDTSWDRADDLVRGAARAEMCGSAAAFFCYFMLVAWTGEPVSSGLVGRALVASGIGARVGSASARASNLPALPCACGAAAALLVWLLALLLNSAETRWLSAQ